MPHVRLLFVCTANQCRSPMAEVIATDALGRRGIVSVVCSAGTEAHDGVPATDDAVATARKLGLDLSRHRSQPVTADLVTGADVVLAMETRHVLDIVNDHGGSMSATFTLPELANLVAATHPRDGNESVSSWLARVTADRSPAQILAAPEIRDPTGRSRRHHRAAARQMEAALTTIIHALSPTIGPTSGGG